jgi:hypothetical protein
MLACPPMISTRDLRRLPDIASLMRVTRALAMLDAILSPEWESRYYSFNGRWAEGQSMASMRNGEGDEWHAIFCEAGAALQGFANDAPDVSGALDGLPAAFHKNLRDEPAFEAERSTFGIWRLALDDRWSAGPVTLEEGDDPDGSAELLTILEGDPKQYVAWARDYYDRDLAESDVAAIYRHDPLTAELISRLNPEVDPASLADDIAEIGYPEHAPR